MEEVFPLSKEKTIHGTRRLAREKALQIIIAFKISGTPLEELIPHIYNRIFNFDEEEQEMNRLLRPEEIEEMDADIKIDWKEEDIEFGQSLINYVLSHSKEFDEMIGSFAHNWELERIALIDRMLMHMAIAELLFFEEIPTKVSVNEAIDIAKYYSTDKSSLFINGILDSLLEKFSKEGKIKKSGRGLKNN